MRIFPIVLITVGVFGVLKHYGFVDASYLHLLWPVLFIGIGIAMLARGPRWRADMRDRMHDRWERRMHRHFGPGWANLSEEERERFRSGMRQWHSHPGSHSQHGRDNNPPAPPPVADDSSNPTRKSS